MGTEDAGELPDYDGSEAYGVFGEGRPRRVVGDSDEPPRRRPRRRRTDDAGPEENRHDPL